MSPVTALIAIPSICHGNSRFWSSENGVLHVPDAQKPQIHHHDQPGEQTHADDVGHLEQRQEQRFPDRYAVREFAHPEEQVVQRLA